MNDIGIIFDCDGTLVDSEHAYLLSWHDAMKIRGSELSPEDHHTFGGLPAIDIARMLHNKVNVDSPEAILEDARVAFDEVHKDAVRPIERTLNFVRRLADLQPQMGFKMAVASASPTEDILYNLNRYNLVELFDVIVSGENDLGEYQDPEGVNKPKPYIYLHTAKLLGLDPSRCVAFEDSRPGVLAATTAGLLTFAVPNQWTHRHDLTKAAYTIHSDAEIDLHEFLQKIRTHFQR
jgi:beta-phosphoglucomutase-like phosphatase (HAD superfamily)